MCRAVGQCMEEGQASQTGSRISGFLLYLKLLEEVVAGILSLSQTLNDFPLLTVWDDSGIMFFLTIISKIQLSPIFSCWGRCVEFTAGQRL